MSLPLLLDHRTVNPIAEAERYIKLVVLAQHEITFGYNCFWPFFLVEQLKKKPSILEIELFCAYICRILLWHIENKKITHTFSDIFAKLFARDMLGRLSTRQSTNVSRTFGRRKKHKQNVSTHRSNGAIRIYCYGANEFLIDDAAAAVQHNSRWEITRP